MRWRREASGGVEDRRGRGMGTAVAGGGGLLGLILALVLGLGGGGGDSGFGIDPGLGGFPGMSPGSAEPAGAPPPDDDAAQFVEFVVGDVQDSWAELFRRAGERYQPTSLVLFEQATSTGCGRGTSQTGPFYCPADSKVYVDLAFFRELSDRFGAPGDFAQAYVIAHEFGHHVQNVVGTSDRVQQAQRSKREDANELSVRLELQADCFAGVWGHSAAQRDLLEPGDLEEGLAAAAAVGDDRIQREATGRTNPETWTHGSSADRMKWFRRGFESGDPDDCDTFS